MSLLYDRAFSALTASIRRELLFIAQSREGGVSSFSELHLCTLGKSSVVSCGERIYMSTSITSEAMAEVVSALCDRALYAHRDTIVEGYISLDEGVRVGVCGQARYEGGCLVGVSEVSSLSFRFPTASCSVIEELLDLWDKTRLGMLIYARAGVGKTTALRTLTSRIAEKETGIRVAVIDERCEFSSSECAARGIDLFKGYKRCDGLNAALRTMAPDVIVIDEVGGEEESRRLLDYMNSGVRIIATAHAASREELEKRRSVEPFFRHGVFDSLAGIEKRNGVYSLEVAAL